MASPTRILFISGEVRPFAAESPLAELTRHLSENLQGVSGLDARLMMPCYGSINERTNRLHEVIRLSGTDVPMDDDVKTLTAKVASLPDTRMQVYFMDHDAYFNRDGLSANEDGEAFPDNSERALFFDRAVLETLRTLRWRPDVIHAFGWISGLVPALLNTEYPSDEVLGGIPVVYTPDTVAANATVPESVSENASIAAGTSLADAGCQHADTVIHLPGADNGTAFPEEPGEQADFVLDAYAALSNEVPA